MQSHQPYMPEKPGKIYEAIAEAMKVVGAVGKDHDNRDQGYRYRSIEDIYTMVHAAFAKAGVFSTSEVLEDVPETGKTKNGGTSYRCRVRIRYTYWATDGSSVSTIVIGEGVDYSDKASSKAMTNADKVAITQLLKLPYAEMDPDKVSPEFFTNDDRATPKQFKELKNRWWSTVKSSMEGAEADAVSTAFNEWVKSAIGSDLSLNWNDFRQFSTDDIAACHGALDESAAKSLEGVLKKATPEAKGK